jgi:two-component system, OmpR family, response regulator
MPHEISARILIVEDEVEIRAILRQALEDDGFSVVEAESRSEALHQLDAGKIDLITLDLYLGHQHSGLDLAREIRSRRNIPIVMITAKDTAPDRVTGLESGADDYIVKPFHLREVVLRIRNVLGRYAHPPAGRTASAANGPRRLAFDDFILDTTSRALRTTRGLKVDLTDIEFRLLNLLLENPARVLSRDEISQALHGRDWSPFDRTIDGHVARLRRKLEAAEDEPRFIKSVRGVGYVFAGDVSSE